MARQIATLLVAFSLATTWVQTGAAQQLHNPGHGSAAAPYENNFSDFSVISPDAVALPAESNTEPFTVELLNSKNQVKVAAGLDTLAVFSTKRPFPSGLPLFLLPDSPFGLDTNSFDAHARQSYISATYSGPEVGGFEVGGQTLTFFQNDNLSNDDYGLLVYFAYGELKNDRWRFSAGLQQDVFNPVSPTVFYLTKLYASGNTGSYRAQFRAERFLRDCPDHSVTLQAALSEPLSFLVASDLSRITEDNGWPNVEGRLELGLGFKKDVCGGKSVRPMTVGLSGVVGQFRTTRTILSDPGDLPPRAVIDTKGVGLDCEVWATHRFGMRGECYYGEGLGEYNGGILQSFNSLSLDEVATGGGFGELFYYFSNDVHLHVGYGIDDPRDSDLSDNQILRNQTAFANLIWDVSKNLQLGIQVDYRETSYTQFLPNAFLDSDATIIATRALYRF